MTRAKVNSDAFCETSLTAVCMRHGGHAGTGPHLVFHEMKEETGINGVGSWIGWVDLVGRIVTKTGIEMGGRDL